MLLHQFLALAAIATPYASAQAIFPSSSSSSTLLATTPIPTSSSTASVASASASGSPTLVLVQPGTFVACATGTFEWRLRNVDPLSYSVTFKAHNSGIQQPTSTASSVTPTSSAIPVTSTSLSEAVTTPVPSSSSRVAALPSFPSSSSSVGLNAFIRDVPSQPLSKRSTLNINQTLGTNPASFAYTLPIVLPQGRYMLVATVPELNIEESTLFSVIETSDKSCLSAFAALSISATQSSTRSQSSTSAVSSRAASSGTAVNGGTASAAGNGISVGAIVGAVIGGLAALGIVGLLVFCCLKRKRRRANEGSGSWGPEAKFRGGSGPATYITRPQRLSSGPTTPPSSSSSHDLSYLNGQPQIPAQAAQNPFATPPISTASERHKRRSIPISPPARPESEVEPSPRRASSPIPSPPGSFDQNVFAGGGAVLARKPSAKRKAVPSLGPELRKEMAKTGSSGGGSGSGGRKEFQLMPDMPLPGAMAGSR